MIRTSRMTWIAAALLLAAAGCDDSPTGPGSEPGIEEPVHLYVGTYQLISVGAEGLPALVFEGPIEVEGNRTALLRVVAEEGTLTLGADGQYALTVRHAATIDGVLSGRSTWTDRGAYAPDDAGFAFASDHIQNVAFRGIGDGDGVITPQDLAGEGRVVAYRFGRM